MLIVNVLFAGFGAIIIGWAMGHQWGMTQLSAGGIITAFLVSASLGRTHIIELKPVPTGNPDGGRKME
ncbi:MAG: hypothetical protein ACP5VS_05235 [Desulfomonilaceae bacterium]